VTRLHLHLLLSTDDAKSHNQLPGCSVQQSLSGFRVLSGQSLLRRLIANPSRLLYETDRKGSCAWYLDRSLDIELHGFSYISNRLSAHRNCSDGAFHHHGPQSQAYLSFSVALDSGPLLFTRSINSHGCCAHHTTSQSQQSHRACRSSSTPH
jgi:hypothetical protein